MSLGDCNNRKQLSIHRTTYFLSRNTLNHPAIDYNGTTVTCSSCHFIHMLTSVEHLPWIAGGVENPVLLCLSFMPLPLHIASYFLSTLTFARLPPLLLMTFLSTSTTVHQWILYQCFVNFNAFLSMFDCKYPPSSTHSDCAQLMKAWRVATCQRAKKASPPLQSHDYSPCARCSQSGLKNCVYDMAIQPVNSSSLAHLSNLRQLLR